MVLGFWGIKVGRKGGFAKTKIYDSTYLYCHRRVGACHRKKNVGGARVWADFVCFLRDFAECG
jgi:hypothetical protein